MRLVLCAILYAACCLTANAAAADPAALEALREGDMRKLVVQPAPVPLADGLLDFVLTDGADAEHRLGDHLGKIVVLNFWATWCAPCRAEMPALDRLQADLGGDDLVVVPVASGRNPPEAIDKFMAEAGIAHLHPLRDPKMQLARHLAVLGLPTTVILDREGREVARLIGDAEWDSAPAKAILQALIDER